MFGDFRISNVFWQYFPFLLFLLAFVLPNHYFPWATAHQDFLSFLGVVLLLFFLLSRAQSAVITPLHLILLALSSIPFFQFAFGVIYFFGDASVASAYLYAFSLAIFIGYNLGFGEKSRCQLGNALALILVAGSVLSVWVALRQWLMLSGSIWTADLPLGARPFANLAQPNNLATLLGMGLAGAIYFYEKYYFGRVVSGGLAFLLLFGLALTGSRTPWVGAVVVIAFLGWKSSANTMRLPFIGFLSWVGVYLAMIFTLPMFAGWLLLPSTGPVERAQSLERWDIWVQFWHAIWLEPFWGFGWNQVSVAQVAISQAYPVPIFTEHSHNIVLDMLLWNGPILGGLIICGAVVWLALLARRAQSPESIFALLAVGFVLVHAMLEYPLEYAFFLLPSGLLLGLVASENRSMCEVIVPRWVLVSVSLFAISLLGWVWHEYRLVEEDYRLMRFESAQIGTLRAPHVAPNVILLTQLREFIRFARSPASLGMSSAQLEWMRKVAHRFPYVPSLFRYSLALAFNGQVDDACNQLLVLRALHGDKYYAESLLLMREISGEQPKLVAVLQRLQAVDFDLSRAIPQ